MCAPWLTVLTTPARPQYLGATLRALDVAGAAELAGAGALHRVIVVDGDRDLVPDRHGWTKISVGHGLGVRRAMWRTMQAAAAANADHLLYFEDDVLPCKNAVLAFDLFPVHASFGFVTAFNSRIDVAALPRVGHIIPVSADNLPGGFWGAQALKLPRRALKHIAEIEITDADPLRHSGDSWLGHNLASRYAPWRMLGVISPSLFQHVGAESVAHPEKTLVTGRLDPAWDAGFDAMKLGVR